MNKELTLPLKNGLENKTRYIYCDPGYNFLGSKVLKANRFISGNDFASMDFDYIDILSLINPSNNYAFVTHNEDREADIKIYNERLNFNEKILDASECDYYYYVIKFTSIHLNKFSFDDKNLSMRIRSDLELDIDERVLHDVRNYRAEIIINFSFECVEQLYAKDFENIFRRYRVPLEQITLVDGNYVSYPPQKPGRMKRATLGHWEQSICQPKFSEHPLTQTIIDQRVTNIQQDKIKQPFVCWMRKPRRLRLVLLSKIFMRKLESRFQYSLLSSTEITDSIFVHNPELEEKYSRFRGEPIQTIENVLPRDKIISGYVGYYRRYFYDEFNKFINDPFWIKAVLADDKTSKKENYSVFSNYRFFHSQMDDFSSHDLSIIELVPETESLDHVMMETGVKKIFITEKTFRSFLIGMIPVVYGAPGTIQTLRDLGYDVYDDIVDHGYDQIGHYQKRMNAVVMECDRLNKNMDEIKKFYLENQDRIRQNQDHLMNSIYRNYLF